jgi:hypothetical protein
MNPSNLGIICKILYLYGQLVVWPSILDHLLKLYLIEYVYCRLSQPFLYVTKWSNTVSLTLFKSSNPTSIVYW